jgi:hypothetical protein
MATLIELQAELEILRGQVKLLEDRIAALEGKDDVLEIDTGLRQYYQGTDMTPALGQPTGRRKGSK